MKNYIYITKTHSAKSVISEEFNSQYTTLEATYKSIDEMETYGKKFHISAYKKKVGSVNIFLATVDSFIYALYRMNYDELPEDEIFKNCCTRILDDFDFDKLKFMRYCGINMALNKKTIVIVDEAQDLDTYYIAVLAALAKHRLITVYIIGDALQSVFVEDNIFTRYDEFIEEYAKLVKPVPTAKYAHISRNAPLNVVRRFHDRRFIDICNTLVPYGRHGTVEIKDICPCDTSCKYRSKVLREEPCLSITWYINLEQYLNSIMETEYARGLTKPSQYLVILPFMKNNPILDRVYTVINTFWSRKANVRDMVEIHKSEPGKPIDKTTSIEKTRIMTIHGAKGDGREIVILLQFDEKYLSLYGDPDSIVYESLFHVALTRQKLRLYVSIESYGDIFSRLLQLGNIDIPAGKLKPPYLSSKFALEGYGRRQSKWRQSIVDAIDIDNIEEDPTYHKIREAEFFIQFCILTANRVRYMYEDKPWGQVSTNGIPAFMLKPDGTKKTPEIIAILTNISKRKIELCDIDTYEAKLESKDTLPICLTEGSYMDDINLLETITVRLFSGKIREYLNAWYNCIEEGLMGDGEPLTTQETIVLYYWISLFSSLRRISIVDLFAMLHMEVEAFEFASLYEAFCKKFRKIPFWTNISDIITSGAGILSIYYRTPIVIITENSYNIIIYTNGIGINKNDLRVELSIIRYIIKLSKRFKRDMVINCYIFATSLKKPHIYDITDLDLSENILNHIIEQIKRLTDRYHREIYGCVKMGVELKGLLPYVILPENDFLPTLTKQRDLAIEQLIRDLQQ